MVPHDGYGGSWRLFKALAAKGHFELVIADLTDPRALAAALAQPPKLVWIETPTNPLLRITDLRFVIDAAHRAGALALVDNTFLSPALQTPIDFGADLVLHSTTKYLNGHSDVVGGAVIARDPALHEQLVWWANALGLTGSPVRQLPHPARRAHAGRAPARARRECAGAGRAPRATSGGQPPCTTPAWPVIRGMHWPQRQQRGAGAMISFELDGGEAAVRAFLDGLRCFTLAESLGGVESLVAHPASMTHAAMSAEARAVAGISDGLLRLSVGIESLDDLAADLEAGPGARAGGRGAAARARHLEGATELHRLCRSAPCARPGVSRAERAPTVPAL